MKTQLKALRLADFLERNYDFYPSSEQMNAAAELRRLHEANQALIHWMEYIQAQTNIGHIHDTASAAIAKREQS